MQHLSTGDFVKKEEVTWTGGRLENAAHVMFLKQGRVLFVQEHQD